jgi:hypothetical protein
MIKSPAKAALSTLLYSERHLKVCASFESKEAIDTPNRLNRLPLTSRRTSASFSVTPLPPPSRIATRTGLVRDADVTESLAGNADVALGFKLRSN